MAGNKGQFKKGHTKSKGRPKGARNKLTTAYIKLLRDTFEGRGESALANVKDDMFLKLVGQLVPKDVDVKHSGDVTINIVDYQDDDE